MLNEYKIKENWDAFRNIINTEFSGDRRDRLNNMYDYFEERIVMTPASGKEHYHNAFPGGYIDHVLRVIKLAIEQCKLWEDNGANINFTREELIFAAMHHDLYKVGDVDNNYYVPNDSQWHREKQGLVYKFNEDLMHTNSTWRTMYLLNYFDIKYTQYEQIGMLCTDGMYSEENQYVLKQHEASKQLKTNLPLILHHADMTATMIEKDRWSSATSSGSKQSPVVYKKKNLNKLADVVSGGDVAAKDKLVNDLFKDL